MALITNPYPSNLSQEQILQRAFDESVDKLRTETTVVISEGEAQIQTSYNEVVGVAPNTPASLISFTGVENGHIGRISVSGTNIGEFKLLVNGVVLDKRRTMLGSSFNESFIFSKNELLIRPGDTVSVIVAHSRPYPGDFNAKLTFIKQ